MTDSEKFDVSPNNIDTAPIKPSDSKPLSMNFTEFLNNCPPGQVREITNLYHKNPTDRNFHLTLGTPRLKLHCDSEECGRIENFEPKIDKCDTYLDSRKTNNAFLVYYCRSCRTSIKTFALTVNIQERETNMQEGVLIGTAIKLGETPAFGPPTPTRLLKLLKPDQNLFLKGRQCENHGLGVGAFAYYRRVVEHKKTALFDAIIKVAKKVESPTEMIDSLQQAKQETQFSKAVDKIKAGIPESLLVNGHNPLKLLHAALSVGVHELSDEECLERAQIIRKVLVDLARRITETLKNDAELTDAVHQLLDLNNKEAKSG